MLFRSRGADVEIKVSDNGVGMDSETLGQLRRAFDTGKSSLGFGLVNVHQRIRLTYGKDYGLTLDSASGQGTVVTVRIPTIEEDHDVENIDLRR